MLFLREYDINVGFHGLIVFGDNAQTSFLHAIAYVFQLAGLEINSYRYDIVV